MTNFQGDETNKQKKKFKKKFKMADSKKLSFSTSSKAEQFPPKFHGLVLGLVRVIYFGKNCSAFGLIPMKISHKLCVRMNGTQFLLS